MKNLKVLKTGNAIVVKSKIGEMKNPSGKPNQMHTTTIGTYM